MAYNVVSRGGGLFHKATSGPITLEAIDGATPLRLVRAMTRAGLEVETRANLGPDQWTKLVVNLNNSVSALSGAPTATILLTPGYRRVLAALAEEALGVLKRARVQPAPLRGLPIEAMPTILRLPTGLVRLVVGAQLKVDPEARSSMWEDLSKGRQTEVDYLNGEVVALGKEVGQPTPLNERVVALVHAAEQAKQGPGRLGPEELARAIGLG